MFRSTRSKTRTRATSRRAMLGAAVALVLAACAGEEAAPAPTPAPAPAPAPDAEPAPVELEGPIRILIGHGVGGGTDSVVRPIQMALQDALGVEVVIENIGGGGGMVAAQQVATSEPDGTTLYAFVSPAYVLQDLFGDQAPDFRESEVVYRLTSGDTNVLASAKDSPIQTLDDLVAAGAAGQDLLMSATSGLSNSTLAWALAIDNIDVDFIHVPYESGSEALRAALDGVTDVTIAALAGVRDLHAAGEVNIIAHFGAGTIEGLEDVTRFGDSYPGVALETEVGIFAPPGTPAAIVAALAAGFEKAAATSSYQDAVSAAVPLGGAEWDALLEDIYARTALVEPLI